MPTSPPPETAVRVRNVIPDIFVNREPQGLWGPDGVGVVKDLVSRRRDPGVMEVFHILVEMAVT